MVKYIEKDEKNRNFDLDNTSDGIPLSQILGWGDTVKEDDVKFLEFAFVHDLPVQLEAKNPKRADTASRLRYEKYKSATTLREVKSKSGTWKDILWDFSRGYIDFRHISDATQD